LIFFCTTKIQKNFDNLLFFSEYFQFNSKNIGQPLVKGAWAVSSLHSLYKGVGNFSKKYLDWITGNQLYNVRMGETKGSMEENKALFDKASILVLYELDNPHKLAIYKITGYKEMSKEDLMAANYPNPHPRNKYMAFSIVPAEMDLGRLMYLHFIQNVNAINPAKDKGTPVFIEP